MQSGAHRAAVVAGLDCNQDLTSEPCHVLRHCKWTAQVALVLRPYMAVESQELPLSGGAPFVQMRCRCRTRAICTNAANVDTGYHPVHLYQNYAPLSRSAANILQAIAKLPWAEYGASFKVCSLRVGITCCDHAVMHASNWVGPPATWVGALNMTAC